MWTASLGVEMRKVALLPEALSVNSSSEIRVKTAKMIGVFQ